MLDYIDAKRTTKVYTDQAQRDLRTVQFYARGDATAFFLRWCFGDLGAPFPCATINS